MLGGPPVEVLRSTAMGLIVVLLASGVAEGQTWQVTDRYSSGPVSAAGPSISVTRSAEAAVRSGEEGARGRDVSLSYGCNAFTQRFSRSPELDTNERGEDVLLVARAPLIETGGAGPRTVLGSYGADGRMIETTSEWGVLVGSEEYAEYRGPDVRKFITALIAGKQIEIRLQGETGVQVYRFSLAGSARAIGAAARHCNGAETGVVPGESWIEFR